jgi:hypothetical protein
MRNDLTFELHRLPPAASLDTLAPFFDDLPLDHYITGSYRRRRLSRFRGPAAALEHLPHQDFMQRDYVNQLLGNIQRSYAELDEALIEHPAFRAFIGGVQDFFGFDPATTVLGVHQIRITCTRDEQGEPAPEGVHQDGFDFITICCIARAGVEGAATEFYLDPKGEPIFHQELQPGEVAYCNDRTIYHYTTPIHPTGEAPGHRDVFVITALTGIEG